MQVQQLPFSWDLGMSQKIDPNGRLLGAYGKDDLETFWYPERPRKGKRREHLRRLNYDPVWDITEMQVKLHVRPIFPSPVGPLTTQLAKIRPLEACDKLYTGESRSKALKRDIEISAVTTSGSALGSGVDGHERQESLSYISGPNRLHRVSDIAREHLQPDLPGTSKVTSPTRVILHLGPRNGNGSILVSRTC